MKPELLERFDRLLAEVLAELPQGIRDRLEESPLIADDRPSSEMMDELGARNPFSLCGLYTGIPLTKRSVEHSGTLPDRIFIFREGIIAAARSRHGRLADAALKRQIRITVLHEIGHHFGLGEADLRKLGYE